MKRLLMNLIFATAVIGRASSADAVPFNLTTFKQAYGTPIMSSEGSVAGIHEYDVVPFSFDVSKGEATLGSYVYEPSAMSASGDVVGIRSIYDSTNSIYNYFFFLTAKGQESVSLFSDPIVSGDNPAISLNDAGRIIVALPDRIVFFNGSTKVSEVLAGSTQSFDSTRGVFVLSNGDALAKLVDLGTPHWARIKSTGELIQFGAGVIEADATIWRVLGNGLVVFNQNGEVFTSDLVNSPVKLALPGGAKYQGLTPIDLNSKGQILAADDRSRTISLGGGDRSVWLLESGKKPIPVNCVFPNSAKARITDGSRLAENGDVLVTAAHRRSSTSNLNGILVPTSERSSFKNYCPRVTMKIVGGCKPYFDGLVQKQSIPGGGSCKLQVRVKDSAGKPVIGAGVITQASGTLRRGKTDSKGELTFNFKAKEQGGSGSMDVIAPYNHNKYHGNVGRIQFLGYYGGGSV